MVVNTVEIIFIFIFDDALSIKKLILLLVGSCSLEVFKFRSPVLHK